MFKILLPIFIIMFATMAHANDAATVNPPRPSDVTGTPIVIDASVLMVNGATLKMIGIQPLRPDQQCWHEDIAWPCGEHAVDSLRHYLEGYLVSCSVSDTNLDTSLDTNVDTSDKRVLHGDCRRISKSATDNKNSASAEDAPTIAEWMIGNGWALAVTSDKLGADKNTALSNDAGEDNKYLEAQILAKDKKKGIWGSKFQHPQDWENGIMSFISDE